MVAYGPYGRQMSHMAWWHMAHMAADEKGCGGEGGREVADLLTNLNTN